MSGRASPIVHAISPQAIGIAAAMLTVTIWAGWFVATRHSVLFSLGPNDVGILRFGVPAIVLAPAWMRVGFFPSTVPARFLILIVLGSGAPYFLVVANATRFANAADVGAMLPGLVPMWTALFGWLIFGERFSALQALGYTLAVLGVLAICALRISSDATAIFHAFIPLLMAAAAWAAYSHVFKRSGLTAFEGAGLVAVWSLIIHIALLPIFGTDLHKVGVGEIVLQLVVQGFLCGLVAIAAYGVALQTLGASPAAAFTALVPVLAACGGVMLLGESLAMYDIIAIGVVAFSVGLGAWYRHR